ncbi:MAG TPA: hypothetical protein VMB85_14150 [Bryobacteraceae bacterium]|jgi:hypothetical protein|nr:hypothetical protein [Bryobacteraceae bacterium]
MPEDRPVGPVIAERVLSAQISDNEAMDVVVRLFAPEKIEDGYCRCYWELVAPDYRKLRYAAGIDGFQAIELAYKMIGAVLWSVAREKGYRLTFEGSEDIGFREYQD